MYVGSRSISSLPTSDFQVNVIQLPKVQVIHLTKLQLASQQRYFSIIAYRRLLDFSFRFHVEFHQWDLMYEYRFCCGNYITQQNV